jgi:diguanylate cyclase (GGDEF)-like protein/PAS domain S-box-containing protein
MAQIGKRSIKRLKRWILSDFHRDSKDLRWLAGTAIAVAGLVIGLRGLGAFQGIELAAYDQLFQRRFVEPRDPRIALVTLDDEDIQHFGVGGILSDRRMADLLTRIHSYQPRAIGLDIYRDVPVEPGSEQLRQIFQTTPNIIGIENLAEEDIPAVPAPDGLDSRQVGFNNVLLDVDGVVRRSTLFIKPFKVIKPFKQGQIHRSFSLQLALKYLEPQSIGFKKSRLGSVELRPLNPNDGAYVKADTGTGYQILADLRNVPTDSPYGFDRIPVSDLLNPNLSPDQQQRIKDLLHDRIVLIGNIAKSSRDAFLTSYSSRMGGNAHQIPGVELQGQFISQLLSAVLDGRSLIHTWDDPLEWLWILGWSAAGALLSWKVCAPQKAIVGMLLTSAGLLGVCALAFWGGWWIPLVPSLVAIVASMTGVTAYFAYQQEEFKKSTEFLNSIINTIPDPVYVKDQQHHWIVLNESYCNFIGHPEEVLINQLDYDFFPPHQAAHFWRQDEATFKSRQEQECEEEFTNAHGKTYLVATKRSLHRDPAGNLFLVGVMRDITLRKQMELALRTTADELVRSNTELAKAKDLLAHIAYHDPLTNLPNRKRFQEQLQQSLAWAREKDHLVALLFLDLDGFKQVNDTHGHQVGDWLLKAVAQRLTHCLRNSDIIARLGGDEFVAILPGIPSAQDVCRVAEKILQTLSQSFVFDGVALSISASIGISIYPQDSGETEKLLDQADTAMYRAKNLGKNRYEFFQTAVRETIDIVVD